VGNLLGVYRPVLVLMVLDLHKKEIYINYTAVSGNCFSYRPATSMSRISWDCRKNHAISKIFIRLFMRFYAKFMIFFFNMYQRGVYYYIGMKTINISVYIILDDPSASLDNHLAQSVTCIKILVKNLTRTRPIECGPYFRWCPLAAILDLKVTYISKVFFIASLHSIAMKT